MDPSDPLVTRLLRPLTAAIAWTAVLTQAVLSVRHGLARGESLVHALVDYASYFTVTTNTLVALVLTVPLLAPGSRLGRWLARPLVQAKGAAAIVVVGIAYHVLLSGSNHPTGLGWWTDLGLHYLVPPLFTAWWILDAPKHGLTARDLRWFAVYPTGYFLWIVARGAVVGEYPYFFVDVSTLGLGVAARNALGILGFYYVVALLLFALTRRQRLRGDATAPTPLTEAA